MDDSWLTYEAVAPLVGDVFTAEISGDGTVALTLTEADDTGRRGGVAPDGRTRSQFTLVFRGPLDAPLAQGTYLIGSERFEARPIFIVPIRADADGRYYEAVFA